MATEKVIVYNIERNTWVETNISLVDVTTTGSCYNVYILFIVFTNGYINNKQIDIYFLKILLYFWISRQLIVIKKINNPFHLSLRSLW